MSKINYLKKIGNLNAAVSLYKNLPIKFKNKIISNVISDLFLKIGDSNFVSNEILRIYTLENMRSEIFKLTSKENPNYFVYHSNKNYLDSLFLQNEYCFKNNIDLVNSINEVIYCLSIDQFHYNDKLQINNKDLYKQIVSKVDSINTIKLISIIQKDSCGNIIIRDFSKLITLFVHLSRFDTSSYTEIINYCTKFCNYETRAYYNAFLTDNRLVFKYGLQKYYTFLVKNKINNSLDFAKIDKNRKEIGLQSLLFDILNLNLTVPDYYIKEFKKLQALNE